MEIRAIKEELEALRIERHRRTGGHGRLVRVAGALFVVVVVVAAWWLWPRAPEVSTAAVREVADRAGAGAVLNASGYVTARRRATVSSKVTGKLVDVRVEEGMPVHEGDVLARLDDAQYRAALALAEARMVAERRGLDEASARLALAEITLERVRRLTDQGVTGQAELDAADSEAEALRARVALAQEHIEVAAREVALRRTELDDTVIRAPFDGVVVSKDAQPGEMVSPISAGGGFTRTGICSIVDMGSLEIEVDVNESYISRVRAGQTVSAVLDAYPDWSIPAKVITPVPTADRQKATVLVRIAFDALDPRMLPDMGIKVTFLERQDAAGEARAVKLVPRTAVRRENGEAAVYVVRQGRVERRAVRLGAEVGDEVEVVAGVQPGEQVVAEGPVELSDGDRVRTR